jgi:serine/threonine-protein kinase
LNEAVETIRKEAKEYLSKPVDRDHLIELVDLSIERKREQPLSDQSFLDAGVRGQTYLELRPQESAVAAERKLSHELAGVISHFRALDLTGGRKPIFDDHNRFNVVPDDMPIAHGNYSSCYPVVKDRRRYAYVVPNPDGLSSKFFPIERKIIISLALTQLAPDSGIVDCYGYGLSDEGDFDRGIASLVFEFMSGGNLNGIVGSLEFNRLTVEDRLEAALNLGLQLMPGLNTLYQHGVYHCDIKPDNLLVHHSDNYARLITSASGNSDFSGNSGNIKISDLGIALFSGSIVGLDSRDFMSAESLSPGSVDCFGSPKYMAPEVFSSGHYSFTDIYALGVILYEMVVGEPIFPSDSSLGLLINYKCNQDKHVPSHIAAQIGEAPTALINSMIERDPSKRCTDLNTLEANMRSALAGYYSSRGDSLYSKNKQRADG